MPNYLILKSCAFRNNFYFERRVYQISEPDGHRLSALGIAQETSEPVTPAPVDPPQSAPVKDCGCGKKKGRK